MQKDNIIDLLTSRGIDISSGVRLMRHTSGKHPDMPKYFGTRAFELYQSVQDFAYSEGSHILGFYGHRPGYALLLGIWRVDSHIGATVAKSTGELDGVYVTAESEGHFFHRVTELTVLDDLRFHLEIEWTGGGTSWNRNLKPDKNYSVKVLDDCPLSESLRSAAAIERIKCVRRLRREIYEEQADDETFLEELKNTPDFLDLPATEREAIILARKGQGQFRAGLIAYWGGCAVTGCVTTEALVASHIIPWRSSDNRARLDSSNGLLLTPNLDKLFDRYLISFDLNYEILISKTISDASLRALGVSRDMKLSKWEASHTPYLAAHRQIFLDYEEDR